MKLLRIYALLSAAAAVCFSGGGIASAQEASPPSANQQEKQPPQGNANPASVLQLTLQDALTRARKNSVRFQAAQTDSAIAKQDRYQAATALLPSVNYNNQALYTQLNKGGNPIFIANNASHEYLSQANVHESLALADVANFRRSAALAAAAKARSEIASRGLVVTVAQDYYAVAAARQKLQSAQKAADEGDRFLKLTQDLERGGEVAHSDVIKAELQAQERRRALQEAQLGLLNARLDLAVLIFPDFNENYEVSEDLHAPVPLPTLSEVQQQAARNNPDIRAALESSRAASFDVNGARAGYLPALSFDYWYGIDAQRFAVNGPSGVSNLGSSAAASVNIPIWRSEEHT